MIFIIIAIFFIIYAISVALSLWLADTENPKSYWYKGDVFVGIFSALPFVNILFMAITSGRFQQINETNTKENYATIDDLNTKMKSCSYKIHSNSFFNSLRYITDDGGLDNFMYMFVNPVNSVLIIEENEYKLTHTTVQPENSHGGWSALVYGKLPKGIIGKDLSRLKCAYKYK